MSDDLEAALKKIPELFKKREEDLGRRERELSHVKKILEEKHPNLGQADDVLELNVGGTPLAMLRRTLTQVEDSLLASKFSGRWDDGLEKDSQGRFFIDQPIELFLPLVNYLRSLASATPVTGPPSPPLAPDGRQDEFYRMVEYYGMTLGVFPIGIFAMESDGAMTPVGGRPDYEITSTQLSTYCLLPAESEHSRYVKSFEVTLDSHSAAQIGWWDGSGKFSNARQQGGQGAGYEAKSIAFDCVRSGIVTNGGAAFTAMTENATVKEGTVIRCESHGQSWSIDGKVIASKTPKGDSSAIQVPDSGISVPYAVPCLTLNGGFRITSIEFDFSH